MVLQPTINMALSEKAILCQYAGKYKYAAIVVDQDGGANAYSPEIFAGVSDTSLADAVTNKVSVIDCAATTTVMEVVEALRNFFVHSGLSHYVEKGDWKVELFDAGAADAVGAADTACKFADDAGTTNNYAEGQYGVLQWVNTAAGVYAVRKRVPSGKVSLSQVAIQSIGGAPTGSGNITRTIYDDAGTTIWTVTGANAAAVVFGDNDAIPVGMPSSVIVKDYLASGSDISAVNTYIQWCFIEEARRAV